MINIAAIVEVKIKSQENYNYVIEYWKEHYEHGEDKELNYIYWSIDGLGSVATISNSVGDVNIRCYGERKWSDLKDWCEQDFQDILTPTQNELVLFDIKYGFEFPFCGCAVGIEDSPSAKWTTQIKNSKHPMMINI